MMKTDETDEEEDDLTEQLLIPPWQAPQVVLKRGILMGQTNSCAHDHTQKKNLTRMMTPPPFYPEGV
jgi:hypothetical protein